MVSQCWGCTETSEERGIIRKEIKAEAKGKVWDRKTCREERQTRMDIIRGNLMWKEFMI